jgi:hypothetical protein
MPTLIASHSTIKLASMSQRQIETNAAPLDASSASAAQLIGQARLNSRNELLRNTNVVA